MKIEPVTLAGQRVRLEPLSAAHIAPLVKVGLDPDLRRWTVIAATADEMRRYIETALAEQSVKKSLPFATIDTASGTVAGSTRFCYIEPEHRRLEIGFTWIAKPWQRTAMNTEAKYLMLRHAFEVLGCIRVEFITDVLNERSRAALLRIGAKQEGILRHHMVMSSGRIRDTVCFSIIDSEWPAVKRMLEERLRH